jgi:beta-glucosidase
MFFQGLDFWSPNINIFRDPRWGRGQETYGEDPFLTARMGVAFVTGMQGTDPRYYKTIATPKHYAVHSGPEYTRHTADVKVSKHDELDTYLPAFRATVVEAKAGSVMCAYNDINGEPACASQFLLQDQLRGKWNFQGYVVSDCGAVVDIFRNHHFKPSQPEASAISLQRGMDNECVDGGFLVKDDSDYKAYVDAVKQGFLKESEIDKTLVRLYTARIKLGMFDPPEMVPYSKISESELNSAANRELAHKIANESMVLLKNDGTLPLKTQGLKIAVVGPLADQTKSSAGQLQRTADAHRFNSGRFEEGVRGRHSHIRGRDAVPRARRNSGACFCAERGWQPGHQGELFKARHEQHQQPRGHEAGCNPC